VDRYGLVSLELESMFRTSFAINKKLLAYEMEPLFDWKTDKACDLPADKKSKGP
jgi:hypothetical protein